MANRKRTALDYYFGPWILRLLGVEYPERPTVELIQGSGVTITAVDDPATDATKVTISSTGGGGGGFTPPTGTGFAHVTAGALDAASKKVDLAASADVTGILPRANGGTGIDAAGTAGNVLTSDGTNWTSSAPAGQAVGAAGKIQASNGSGAFTAQGPYVGADYISLIAGTPDVPGVRLANNTTFSGRNFDGTADIIACYIDSANQVRVGSNFDATQTGILFATPSGGGHTFAFQFGTSVYAYLSENEFAIDVPRHGYTTPYASEGQASFAVTATSHTLTPTEYTRRILKFTGTLGGTSTITFPLPSTADKSYGKSVRNTSTSSLVLTNGGTTYTVAAGTNAEIIVTPDGIFGVTTTTPTSSAGSANQIQASNGSGGFIAPGPYVGAAYISIISGTPTNSGFRMGNTHRLSARNSGNTADRDLCQLDASDVCLVGDLVGNTSVRASGTLTLTVNGGATTVILTASKLTTNVPIELGGGTLATAGLLRTQTAVAEPLWQAGTLVGLDADASNIYIGGSKSFGSQFTNVRVYGASFAFLGIGSNNYFVADGGIGACRADKDLKVFGKLSGYQNALKYAYTDLSFSGSDITLSSAQQETPILKCNNASGNIIAPDTRGSTFIVDNTASTVARTIKKSAGTGVSCPASKTTTVYHNGTDYAVQSQF